MVWAIRLFLLFLLVLAYCEDRYLSRPVTIGLIVLAHAAFWVFTARVRRRR